MSMQKYGVDETPSDKSANSGEANLACCPKCGRRVEQHGNVMLCKQCGSAPFERDGSTIPTHSR